MFSKDEVIKIFCKVDDFCKEFESEIIHIKQLSLPSDKKRRNRQGFMSCSEILTILICFHLGAHKTFKDYYLQIVRTYWSDLFPKTLSYNRFIEIQHRYFFILALFLKEKCLGKCTGISFVDSTTLKVCKNQRIIGHKTFKNIAERGKSSMGWFYGFKLHLVCNEKGELLSFYLTKGNVDDRNIKHMKHLCKQLFGKLFADRGYIGQALWQMLFEDGIQLFTRIKKNMKNHLMSMADKILLRKRAIIETINDELKNRCQIEHSRHRGLSGFIMNTLSALTAYCFFPKKPALNLQKVYDGQLFLQIS